MKIESIHIIRRRNDGALLGTIGRPSAGLLEEADEIASAYRPSNIGPGQVNFALSLMLADLGVELAEWARRHPDKPVFIDK